MGRTLYLNENQNNIRIRRDGPSVLVKSREKADQRVPVRLLGRVIIIGNVMLDSASITLFAENDIPVVFMNNLSDETAVVIPYNHRLPKFYEEQKVFLDSDETIARYENWANAKRMVIQVRMLEKLFKFIAGKVKYGIGEGNYQELLSDLKPPEEKWMTVSGIVNNLFRGLIAEHVLKAHLDPHLGIVHRRHNFGLVLDICYIMGAESDMQCLQFFRCKGPAPFILKDHNGYRITNEGMRDIIHRFENRRIVLHNLANTIVDELFELMREIRA